MRPSMSEMVESFKKAERDEIREARKKFYDPKPVLSRDELAIKYNAKLQKAFGIKPKKELDREVKMGYELRVLRRERSKILELLIKAIDDLDMAIKSGRDIQKSIKKELDLILNGGYEI